MRASGCRPSWSACLALITTHRGGAVVEARRIARGHAAGLVERGPQAGQRFGAGLLVDELVGREHDRVALLLRDRDRHDLVLEAAGFLRGGGLLLRGQRERVLLLARDAVLLGHVLGRDAHVVLVVHVPQAVGDHRVDQLPVAHALAVARVVQHVRRQAHALLAAGDHDLAVAVADRLRGQHHGLQARAAHLVDRQRRHRLAAGPP